LIAIPVTVLYDRGLTVITSDLLHQRIPDPYAILHPQTSTPMGIKEGAYIKLNLSGTEVEVIAHLDETIPEGVVLVPRSMGIPIHGPTPVDIVVSEQAVT
jgi:anaerobic selenocysteine-containing dehydrogenase